MSQDLLRFAESVANHHSANLHGFHADLVAEARQLVKRSGGRLDKVGRYAAGSAARKPHEKYINGQWRHAILNHETDTWIFPPQEGGIKCQP